jgi:hypothetical protein
VILLNDPFQEQTLEVFPIEALNEAIRNLLFAWEPSIKPHHISDGRLISGPHLLCFLLSRRFRRFTRSPYSMPVEQMSIRVLDALFRETPWSWVFVLDTAFADPSAAALEVLNIVPETPYPR